MNAFALVIEEPTGAYRDGVKVPAVHDGHLLKRASTNLDGVKDKKNVKQNEDPHAISQESIGHIIATPTTSRTPWGYELFDLFGCR